jgi:hypothetical protein
MTSDIPYIRNGKRVSREEFYATAREWPLHGKKKFASHVPMTSTAYDSSKPLQSVASACHPSQVQEFNEEVKKAGLTGVEYKPDGTCEFTSRSQRAKWNRHRGLRDNDAGYGD